MLLYADEIVRHSALACLVPASVADDHALLSLSHLDLVDQLLHCCIDLVVSFATAVLGVAVDQLVNRLVVGLYVQVPT